MRAARWAIACVRHGHCARGACLAGRRGLRAVCGTGVIVDPVFSTKPEVCHARSHLSRAGQTLRNLEWFEVTEIRGQIADGAVAHFQVGLKVGFRLEDAT